MSLNTLFEQEASATFGAKGIRIGIFATAAIVIVVMVLAWNAPRRPHTPLIYKLSCLQMPNGQQLIFEPGGVVLAGETPVADYRFKPAVGGKHGPLIEVWNTQVVATRMGIEVRRGTDGWFWRFIDKDHVAIASPDQSMITAVNCGSDIRT